MPRTRLLTLLFLALSAAGAPAQMPLPSLQRVVADIDVRGGPADSFPPVLKLRQGDYVLVLRAPKETPGWVAIKPPPGSFSWIDGRFVRVVEKYGLVEGEPNLDIPLYVGSAIVKDEPKLLAANIRPGFLVTVLGSPASTASGQYYPIAPMPHEVRWLPSSALGGAVSAPPPPPLTAGKPASNLGEAIVKVALLDVRSAPRDNASPTSRLRANDKVSIVRESPPSTPGWLAIRPPAGSFSWIQGKYLKVEGRSGVVEGDAKVEVPVLAGSNFIEAPPTVETGRVRGGTRVALLDQPMRTPEGGLWYPIQPVADEVRWIPASAVRRSGPVPMPLPPEK
jgi:hypothetical protein